MLASYRRFESQIQLASKHLALGHLLDLPGTAVDALAGQADVEIPSRTERRRLVYRSAIIEIYAALEEFVMDSAEAYAGCLHFMTVDYRNLSENVRSSNFNLTLRALELRDRQPWRSRVVEEEMLDRLLGCLRDPIEYRLNSGAFREHSSNFRSVEIERTFKRLDVDLRRLMDVSEADAHVRLSSPLSGIVRDARGVLDLLAERRNEIAHGYSSTETLSFEVLKSLLCVVRLYGRAMHAALLDALAEMATVPKEFGTVESVFSKPVGGNGRIAGVRARPSELSLRAEDWVIFRGGGSRALLARTRTIQINRVPTSSWHAAAKGAATGGVWVDRNIGVGWSVCIVPYSIRRALGLELG